MPTVYAERLRSYPDIVLLNQVEPEDSSIRLLGIAVGSGRLAVHGESTAKQTLTPQQSRFAALAAVGMSNTKIGEAHSLSFWKVKTQLDEVFETLQIKRRPQIARSLLELGFWEIAKPAEPLPLTNVQIPIIEKVSEGLSDKEIADELHYSPANVHQHIVRIGHRTGWKRRESIALASMLSGEIGNLVDPTASP